MYVKYRFAVGEKYNGEKYKEQLHRADLAVEDKLFLLQIVGGKLDYEYFIPDVIAKYREAVDVKERRWLRGLLQEALG